MSTAGALIGLVIAIILIVIKVSPVYSLMAGAFLGGILSGFGVPDTVGYMVSGIQDIAPAIARILAAGVLSGILIKCGAASSIATGIVRTFGRRYVFLALALSTMLITAVGVFIDVAIITVAPIALMLGRQYNIPKMVLLIVLIGGGKCGNIISPNPNTIVAAENLHASLSSVMALNIIPAVIGLAATVFLVTRIMPSKGEMVTELAETDDDAENPSFASSIVAPLVSMLLLSLRPIAGISIDPMIALPIGGIAGITAMRKWNRIGESLRYGLDKMSVVAVLLVATGTIAGIIKASTLRDDIMLAINGLGLNDVFIAPISGILMSAATASSTAGATIASSSFADILLALGIGASWNAAMINSGATVLDHLPHGSFFHATGGSVEMSIKERLKLIPYETLIGFVLAASTVGCYFLHKLIF